MQSVLAGVTRADIRAEPFPHIVVPDVLPPDLYRQLCASYPPFARIGWASPELRIPSNQRFAMSASLLLAAPDLPAIWKEFCALHTSLPFFEQVLDLFADHLPPAMRHALDAAYPGTVSLYNPACTLSDGLTLDARLEVNTPVSDRPSVSRGPHLDTPNRLYSGLFYMRHPDDDSIGGDLHLFRWRDRPAPRINAHELPPEFVEHAATIPYRANQLVLFPQGINALHGVEERQPTPHTRRYVFITAELAEDWLHVPTEGA